jgi:hypothetical protein
VGGGTSQRLILHYWQSLFVLASKSTHTFYTKVMAPAVMAHLNANSGGLHAINMISFCLNMTQYYVQADGISQFIVMMEDA